MKPTLHVVALPHTATTAVFSSCAYTQKIRKFVPIMRAQGYRVILYGSELTDVEADEHVTITTEEERAARFGPGFDTVLTPLKWESHEPYWATANAAAAHAIAERCDRRDLLCLIAGWAQQPISLALPFLTAAEWGVGYEGVLPNSHRAFESAAWKHYVYGKQGETNGRWYDAVIPNFFDPADFPRLGRGDGGYLLYLGRLVHRKGVEVAWQIAQRCGRKLIVAGPGAIASGSGYVRSPEVTLRGPRSQLEYVGEVGIEERAELLEHAAALLAATLYVEPFGGVAVEAMLAGTPAVTSDFGAFTETVEEGVTGYRFRTLAEGAEAVERAVTLNRHLIRRRALARFSMDAVGPMFDRWFGELDGLWEGGWDA